MILLWSAFLMGLLGNVHCLGMCGPIALAIPVQKDHPINRIFGILVYNLGRVMLYASLGAFLGAMGYGVQMAGMQQQLALVLGSLILLWAIITILHRKNRIGGFPAWSRLLFRFKQHFGKQLSKRSFFSLWLIGVLNGLLPCGLVYMALIGATATFSWQYGALFMAIFGLGTLPVMIALPFFGNWIHKKVKLKFSKVLPFVMIVFAALLILRGANLGIPYVSPQLQTNTSDQVEANCH